MIVMMLIILAEMDAVAHVRQNQDGHAMEELRLLETGAMRFVEMVVR